MSFVESTVAPFAMTSAPSSTVVWAERDTPSVRVPAPVFVSSPVVGALIVAATSSFTLTIAAVSVEEPPTVVLARKSTKAADTSPLTVAESSAVLNTAVLPFCTTVCPGVTARTGVSNSTRTLPSGSTTATAGVSGAR